MPVPYQIPYEGPTGRRLGHLGSHTWRPAHVHFKVRKDGFEPLTTQYYFEGGKWVDDDCCHGVTPDLITPERSEEHTSELQSLMRISYAVFCLKKKIQQHIHT